jgi:RNA polymerase sigma-70 factor (ECF subfamily)
VISVVKNITQFTYDPQKGSFKGWLLTLTRWRIMDQFRMRQKEINNETPQAGTEPRTDIVERIADPSTDALEEIWDQEWRQNIFELALQNVMQRVDPKNYQIFDLHVVRKWSMAKVANALKVNRASVYLAKHRISKLLRSEIKTLETQILDNERHKAK